MDRIRAHDMIDVLDREGIAVRAGHHCALPLHKRFGVTAPARASFSLYNASVEVEHLSEALHRVKSFFRRKRGRRFCKPSSCKNGG
jgi:cysteine desulfurase/selenocysteine lyase